MDARNQTWVRFRSATCKVNALPVCYNLGPKVLYLIPILDKALWSQNNYHILAKKPWVSGTQSCPWESLQSVSTRSHGWSAESQSCLTVDQGKEIQKGFREIVQQLSFCLESGQPGLNPRHTIWPPQAPPEVTPEHCPVWPNCPPWLKDIQMCSNLRHIGANSLEELELT